MNPPPEPDVSPDGEALSIGHELVIPTPGDFAPETEAAFPVPEPAIALLGALGFLLILCRRR